VAIYAIGDIQGCHDELLRLLDAIDFEAGDDQLWFTGDLVNRGPKSLETLRFVKSLGKSAVTVLGNHDLHLLAAASENRKPRKKDTLDAILAAPDREELLDWLRRQPLLHYNDRYCLIHAGLPPQWDFKKSKKMAARVTRVLAGNDYEQFLAQMYGNMPDLWSEELQGVDLLRFIVNCFTRMRYCHRDGRLDFQYHGPPGSQPKHLLPWFAIPGRKTADINIVFGHWSTLGFHDRDNCYGIDTGCLWGGKLTALKLTGKMRRIDIDCPGAMKPG